ncbi:Potassium ion channel Yvc1 [Seminavis robusta]|uniref:Potassium ion channel Yvc1 n=1 Tax=Seminavis robusta TaxID=568900 RepID=A0A9N8HFU9_9STRA|nr:Potassium ion channel Yvc1 [Seminavis robusta]|eukprot:Sro452_g145890.1 Potassium ion channel Yvc1 (1755) ;mRNA; f:31183-36942
MQRQKQQQRRRRRRRSSTSSNSQAALLCTSASWPATAAVSFYPSDDDDDDRDHDPLPLLAAEPPSVNMVYQYAFEEGLELSLVPENEAPPFTSGPKVLELGLSGFTGRLIITQQAIRQYALYGSSRNHNNHEEKKDESVSVISSSSSESEGRHQQQRRLYSKPPMAPAAATAKATRTRQTKSPPVPQQQQQKSLPDTSKRKAKDPAGARKPGKPDPSAAKVNNSSSRFLQSSPPPRSSSKRKGQAPSPPAQQQQDAIDDIAAVFASSQGDLFPQHNTNVAQAIDSFSHSSSTGVEVVSVASTVSTRAAAAHAEREDTLDQFASIFATHQEEDNKPSGGDIDEEKSAAVSSSHHHRGSSSRGSGSHGGNSRGGEPGDDPVSDFATAFVSLSAGGPSHNKPPADSGGSIDDEASSMAEEASASAAADSETTEEASNASTMAPPAEDAVSDFAAFVSSGPTTNKPETDGGSIDDDDDDESSRRSGRSSAAASNSAASRESSSSSSAGGGHSVIEEHASDVLIGDFTTAFVALSGPPTVPEVALGSIDEESATNRGLSVVSETESSVASQSYESSRLSQAGSPSTPQDPPDAMSDFVTAFGQLTGPTQVAQQQTKREMIDEESIPSRANSSSLSSSSSGQQSRESSKQESVQQGPVDPMTDFVTAFGALTRPTPEGNGKGQMIDEDSPSSVASGSATTPEPQSSNSRSSSEDPLTQFTKAFGGDPAGQSVPARVEGPRIVQAPQAPSESRELQEQSKPETKATTPAPAPATAPASAPTTAPAKKRMSQKNKTKKAATGAIAKARISIDKKRKIREMFPNYPDVSTGSAGSQDPVGVYLHQKCSAPYEKTLPPKDLRELLEVFPFAAYCADDKGRLPLHVLGENGRLVKDPQGRQRATALAKLLITAYPQSVTYPDSDGRLPFVALLQQWIEVHYEHMSGRFSRDTKQSTLASMKKSLIGKSGNQEENKPIQYDKLFPAIDLWPYAEWCLSMLSMILDDMLGKGVLQEALGNRPLAEQMEARRQYVGNVLVSVPLLVKSVLFLDGGVGSSRKRILQMPFIRRALLTQESVGTWLEGMCLRQGTPSKLAIDYFQLLSQTTPLDYVGPKRTPDEQDEAAFHRERETVYRAIEELEVIIPSLVVLDEKETERAATTNVVWFIMNRNLAQPFVVGLLLIDFTLHVTLMLSFRNDVNLPSTSDTFLARTPPNLVPVICTHYIVRKGCEALSFLLISKKAFWEHFVSLWNVVDTLTHILTLIADLLRKERPERYEALLNALVLALLWIKVLGFLKFANKEMATFVLALIQIVKDIRFFIVVLFVVIFMFADMIHVIATTKEDAWCDSGNLSDAQEDFCSPWSLDYYYRMYAVLLGDFELDDYTQTREISIIFFTFTILGSIILLNVLIAVISDSYANSKESSLLLFGRARVGFVAQQIALESFLRPGNNPLKILQTKVKGVPVLGNAQVLITWKWTSMIIRWLVVFSLLGSALTADIFLLNEMSRQFGNPLFFFLYLFFALVLLIAIWVVGLFVFGDFLKWIFCGIFRPCMSVADHWARLFTYLVTVNVFGLSAAASSRDEALLGKAEKEAAGDKDDGEDRRELMEQFFILEKHMEKSMRQAMRKTEMQLSRRIEMAEERLISAERTERAELMSQLSSLIQKLDSSPVAGAGSSTKVVTLTGGESNGSSQNRSNSKNRGNSQAGSHSSSDGNNSGKSSGSKSKGGGSVSVIYSKKSGKLNGGSSGGSSNSNVGNSKDRTSKGARD